MNKHYIVKNKIRFTFFVVVSIIFITCFINICLGLNNADSLTKTEYYNLNVTSGDTLWSIAETYMPSDMDIREAVYSLCSVNDISASDLCDGMTIKIPIYH